MLNIILTRSEIENNRIILENKLHNVNYISWPQIKFIDLEINFKNIDNSSLVITSKYTAQIVATNYMYNFDCYIVGIESANIIKTNKFHG